MRRILVFCFVLAVLIFYAISSSYAIFRLELDRFDVGFGSLNLGETKYDIPADSLKATITTDTGNSFKLQIRNLQPFTSASNPLFTIENRKFWWYGVSTTGSGTLVTTQENFVQEKTVYTGVAGEGASGIDVEMKFRVDVPENNLLSGRYTSDVVLTATE